MDRNELDLKRARALLHRLDGRWIATTWAGHPEAQTRTALDPQTHQGVHLRYRSLLTATTGTLDGHHGFEDVSHVYLRLDAIALRDHATAVGRLLLEDLTHWAARRKPPQQRTLLIVDEFSAINEDSTAIARMVERLRSYNTAFILTTQSYAALGNNAERLLDAAATIIVHTCPDPEGLTSRAGTRTTTHPTLQTDRAGTTGLGSLRLADEFTISPNAARQLSVGEAFGINGGKAGLVRVIPAGDG